MAESVCRPVSSFLKNSGLCPSRRKRQVIALLGPQRRSLPTPSKTPHLGDALQPHEFQQIRRPWALGASRWGQSLRALQLQAAEWRGTWVLGNIRRVAWVARGFPSFLESFPESPARPPLADNPPCARVAGSLPAFSRSPVHTTTSRPFTPCLHSRPCGRRPSIIADAVIFKRAARSLSWLRRPLERSRFHSRRRANVPSSGQSAPSGSSGTFPPWSFNHHPGGRTKELGKRTDPGLRVRRLFH